MAQLSVRSTRLGRKLTGLVGLTVVLASVAVPVVTSAPSAGASGTPATSYSPGTPSLATITNGTSQAPWNTSQGDPSATAYPQSDLLPTYIPGGPTTTTANGASGANVTEPNVAVYAGSNSGSGVAPYPSGVVGTPGPDDGYCGTGNYTTEAAGSPVRQPNGTTLPFSPAYFPHIVRNADGSLTGYFDYRPKDTDEAVVAARSTDNGKDWTYEGEALEENGGYCPVADVNDDGQGHANVITVGGVSRLYTLPRAAGDIAGVGMLVHTLTSTGANPLAGLPATEKTGIDPDAFATATSAVPATGGTGATISLNQTGQANSPEQLVPGPFVDLTLTPTPTASNIITCTGVGTTSLTGCTTATHGGVTISSGDLIEQVMAVVGNAADPVGGTIPTGPNITTGTGGIGNLYVTFSNNITATIYNNNAPNRIYVDGVPVYCNQANATPTQKVEDCTTGAGGPSVTAAVGDPILSDPIVPATAQQTNGLVAPDGIVGVLPSYPGAPTGSTVVMYTEKLLNYYMAGVTSAAGTYTSNPTGSTITFYTNPNTSSALPTPTTAHPVTVIVSDDTAKTDIPATCTGLTVPSGSMQSNVTPQTESLTGCTVPAADSGHTYTTKTRIGAPGLTTESSATLAKTGEGSTNQDKFFANNEDLTVLRVAYTTDGINFSTSGLDNGGVISGQSNGSANYTDINNPSSTADPAGGPNAYGTAGTTLTTEMRFVGSAGSIIVNPDGSYGLFLSGAWGVDGDSDAFNQIFYATSTDGEHWTKPVDVISTDYSFASSRAQDVALASGTDAPLGIHAYYEGRAYGPSVVENSDGTLTMVFAGYRMPKGSGTAGAILGTNAAAQYTVGNTDPDLYRNILSVTLNASTYPLAGSTTSLSVSPASPVAGQSVTYTATVTGTAGATVIPTGTVTFAGTSGTLCSQVALSFTSPDTATCTTTYGGSGTSDVVTATYNGDSNYATSSDHQGVTVTPALSISASVQPSAYGSSGATETYSYLVTNLSPDPLASLSVSDSSTSGISCPSTTLAAETSEACTGTYVTTQSDVDTGTISDTATATATDGTTSVSSSSATATADASAATSSLSVMTDSLSSGYAQSGDSLVEQYTVTNTGTRTLSQVAVSSSLAGTASCPAGPLAPGVAEICTATYSVTQADVDTGAVSDVATATAVDPQSATASATAPTLTITASGATSALSISTSTLTSSYGQSGDVVTDQYSVANVGTRTLDGVAVTSSLGIEATCPENTLAPGTAETCTSTYVVSQADVDAGSITDAASASATDPQDATITSSTSSVTVEASDAASALSVTLSPSLGGIETAGALVPVTYTVTNTGTRTLTDVGVDTGTLAAATCLTTTLAPGASTTCSSIYDVTPADIAATGTTLSATATATDSQGSAITSIPATASLPLLVPTAPVITAASESDSSATLTWAAPSYSGTSSITDYTVSASPGNASCVTALTSCTLHGLTNGQSYTFTVVATNDSGSSPASAPSTPVTPITTPGAPSITAVVGHPGSLQVTWSAPASNGGAAISGYTAAAHGNGTTQTCSTTSATSCTIAGLVNGDGYTVTVTATNAAGAGAASSPSAVVEPTTNDATFTGGSGTTVTEGKTANFFIDTSGTRQVTLTTVGQPAWLTVKRSAKTNNFKFLGVAPLSPGTETFTVEANDGVGPATVETVTITIVAKTKTK